MSDPRTALTTCKRVVVKIGSRLLAESPAGRPAAIADQIQALRARGIEVVVVSSGALDRLSPGSLRNDWFSGAPLSVPTRLLRYLVSA